MKNPASFQTATAIIAGIAVAGSPSQLCRPMPADADDAIEQAVIGREEEQPDVGDRDHRQHRRREIRHAQQRPAGQVAVDGERHQQREHHGGRESWPAA